MKKNGRKKPGAKKPPQKPRQGNHIWKRGFLAALAKHGNVTHACRAAKIDRGAAYQAKDTDADFSDAWDKALEGAADELEMTARKLADKGNATLIIFLLKGLRPEKYRERFDLNQAGELRVRVIEDESWYGNRAHDLAAEGTSPPVAGSS